MLPDRVAALLIIVAGYQKNFTFRYHIYPSHSDIDVEIILEDVYVGMKQVPPSAMRELIVQVPKVGCYLV